MTSHLIEVELGRLQSGPDICVGTNNNFTLSKFKGKSHKVKIEPFGEK